MPVYTYQVIHEDGSSGETFEVIHGMNDPPLRFHPETGATVRRVFSAPHIAGWANARKSREMLSDSNLEKHGFTKYVRSGKGQYEKRTGKGPASLDARD